MWRRLTSSLVYLADRTASTRSRSCARISVANDAIDFQEMPSPKGLPFIGTTLALLAAGSAPKLHRYVDKRHAELGQIYRESIGPVHAVFVSDPVEMRAVFNREGKYPKHVLPDAWILYNKMYGCSRGLFFMDGEEWLHFRRILNKLLLKNDTLSWIYDPCEEVASDIVRRWENLLCGNDYAVIDNLEKELYKFSIDTLVAVLVGEEYFKCKQSLEAEISYLASVVHLIFKTSAKLSLIPASWAAGLRLSSWKQFVSAANDGISIANRITEKIMSESCNGNGLITKMMQENMNKRDIQRIVADLILAAGDTTAYSMEWTIYLLSKHKDVQEKLVQYNNDTTRHTNLMKGIVREALRLYPVAPFLTRILPQDTCIGGYLVPAGTLIIMSLYSSSRNAKYFLLPEKFWPERWYRSGNREFTAASPYASLPFAMGARSCIGRRIAEIQMQAALTKITNRFHLECMNETNVEMVLRMVSVPSVPVSIKISTRR